MRPFSVFGMSLMVRALAVTSSPVRAVAARRRAHQLAVLVTQRQRQPVDLRLGDDRRNLVGIEPEKAPYALDEIGHVLVAEGVAERQHRHRMLHFCETPGRRRADFLRRRLARDQFRKSRLDGVDALAQRVIGGVRNLRRVFLIVVLVVALDLKRQPLVLDLGLRLGELCNRCLVVFLRGHFIHRHSGARQRNREAGPRARTRNLAVVS